MSLDSNVPVVVFSRGVEDDQTEHSHLVARIYGEAVLKPLRQASVNMSAALTFADGALGGGNRDGSGCVIYVNGLAAMPAAAAATQATIEFRARGTFVGVRFNPLFNGSGDSSYYDFDLEIDGIAYRIPRKRLTDLGALSTYANEVSYVIPNLPDCEHVCRIVFGSFALRGDYWIFGIVVDRNAGYEPETHPGTSTLDAAVPLVLSSINGLWSNPERLGVALKALQFYNSAVSTTTVTIKNSQTGNIWSVTPISTVASAQVPLEGAAGFLDGTLKIIADQAGARVVALMKT